MRSFIRWVDRTSEKMMAIMVIGLIVMASVSMIYTCSIIEWETEISTRDRR